MRTCLLTSVTLAAAIAPALSALQQDKPVQFSNAASSSGIDYKHQNGATPEKYMPETMAAGALIFDYNSDGWPDLFFVNGGSFIDRRLTENARHQLYRNAGSGRFVNASAESGIGVSGFGMGACSADYDNDGWADLYVTTVGRDKLYHNTGHGSFTDVSSTSGIAAAAESWSASCAFADIDNDGDVDLYVTRYVDFSVKNNKYCTLFEAVRSYCHPNVYNGLPDILYRNNGDGTFTDVTQAAGVAKIGNGLGVVFGDYDDDGWIDIYVANDSTPNFLFHNKGNGVFDEVGFRAGVAVGIDGKALAGMGADMGDVTGDGLLDIFVTNLDGQTHSLYKNLGKGLFADVTFPSGLGEATLPFVGFGTAFFDYDNDGDLDLAIANGDVIDNVKRLRDSTSYEQPNLLLRNDGSGKFTDMTTKSGPGFALRKPSRGLAVGDLDNDGDLEVLVSNVGSTADLLRNEGGNRSNSLLVRLVGSTNNRDGIGARLTLHVGGKQLVREVKAGSSYLGQNDLRVHFGLGAADRADRLEIRWPMGAVETIQAIAANQVLTVVESKGVTNRQPFVR